MSGKAFSKLRLEQMHETMTAHVERGSAPGVVTLVSRDGETHVDAIGTLAVDSNEPVRRDTIMRISSMTKPVTAVAALMLVEDCVLRLDDPIDEFLPELANRQVLRRPDGPLTETVPAARSITVRDLLTFTPGWGIVMALPGTSPIGDAMAELTLGQGMPAPSSVPAVDEWLRRFGTLPLLHQPGEQWMYNTGSDLLGALIARASGSSFDAFLRERVFEPLGMHDTGFRVAPDQRDRFATAYVRDPHDGSLRVYDEPDGQWAATPAFPAGGSGLVSTVDDYHAFATMLLRNGEHAGERILARASVELMTTDQLSPAVKAVGAMVPHFFETNGWGFGVSIVTHRRGFPCVGTYGWDGGLGSTWANDPREGLITIMLTQAAWPSPEVPAIARDFTTLAYAALRD